MFLNNNKAKERRRGGREVISDQYKMPIYNEGEELKLTQGLHNFYISYHKPKVTYISSTPYFITVALTYENGTKFNSTIHRTDLISGTIVISNSPKDWCKPFTPGCII